MSDNDDKEQHGVPVQVFVVRMDNDENQDELNRLMTKGQPGVARADTKTSNDSGDWHA